MKKVISTMLALVMVLAIVAAIPMTASADTTTLNTSRYFDANSSTGLDASKGTPAFVEHIGTTLGAINSASQVTTLKDSSWDNAVKLTVNSQTSAFFRGNTSTSGGDYDVWLLWDNDNLYILQEVRVLHTTSDTHTIEALKTSEGIGQWGGAIGGEQNFYQILLPREMNYDNGKPTSYAIASFACLNDPAVAGNTIYESSAHVRDFKYTTTTGVTGEKDYWTGNQTFEAGIRTFIERLDTTGYRAATVIPWDAIDSTTNKEFANSQAKEGQTIGLWLYNKANKHINGSGMSVEGVNPGTSSMNDTAGFDPVTLLNTNTATPLEFSEKITPDLDYWLNETTGQFIVKPFRAGNQTYEISTAAQLLALANILEAGTGDHSLTILGIESSNKADKYLLSRGHTFKLMNDIDLNPGVTDWASVNDILTKKNAGEAFDLSSATSKLPSNVFVGFDRFFGTIDGQGHVLKGLYNPDTKAVSWRGAGLTNATGGLIGQLCQGGIKDLYVESGYVGTIKLEGNVMFGGLVGEIRTETYTDYANAEIYITNVYVGRDFTAHRYGVAASTDTNKYAFAGVASSVWPGIKDKNATVNATFSNIVFNGRLIDNPVNAANSNYPKDLVLGNNFGTNDSSKTISNGSTKIATTYTNIIAVVEATPATNAVTATRYAKLTEGEAIPASKADSWVKTEDGGVAPLTLADRFSDVKWQATQAADGTFAIRFVAEAYTIENWKSIGFEVVLNDGTDDTEFDNIDNNVAYESILAAGETKTADDLGIIDGDYLYVFALNGLDASKTYTATVKVVYTDAEDNIVESIVAHTLTDITAWDGN